MPEADGTLTEADKTTLNAWLKTHWPPGFRCPICQSEQWTVVEHIIEARPFQGGGFIVGLGPIYPFVAVLSIPCGYTILFNAMIAGIVQPPSASLQAAASAPSPSSGSEEKKDV